MASNKLGRRKRKELSPRQMKLIRAGEEGKTYKQAAIEAEWDRCSESTSEHGG
jgi:hypothetical protein